MHPLKLAAVVGMLTLCGNTADASPVDVLAGAEPRTNMRSGNKARPVPVRGQEFDRAVRVETLGGSHEWHAQILADTTAGIAAGDVFCVRLWLKAVDVKDSPDGKGRAIVHFHNGKANKAGLLVREKLSVGPEWTEYSVPFVAPIDGPAEAARLMLNLNGVEQTILVGPLSITNYGPDYPLSELTRGLASYDGQAADAPWRAEAAERIARYRTGPLAVRVVDGEGRPVAGAEVDVRMRRHAFAFGSSVTIELLTLGDEDFPVWSTRGSHTVEDGRRYREIVTSHFTRITPEGALRPNGYRLHRAPEEAKHHKLSAKKSRAFDRLAAFTREHGIEVRGHCLSWGAVGHGPWGRFGGSRDEHYAAMTEILDEIPAACGGLVAEWDTLNHPCGWGVSIEDLYGGLDMHVEIMRRARENAPPGTRHYVNEGHVITERSRVPDYERVIKYLIANGQGPDGIGMMAHFDRSQLTGMDDAWAVLQRFAKLAPRLQLTELDVSTAGDDDLQADYLRDIMTLCFSHPQMDGIVMWGFWEGHHWKPETALWRKDWSIKPAGEAWLKLVKDDWWTTETVTTDAAGRATVPHAFYGDYTIGTGGVTADASHRAGTTAVVKLIVE
ncbi:MAG: endo-1,4-beta-xylanase [Planctomycetota bacterium]